MLIDEQLGYLIAFVEGWNSRPWGEWWRQYREQLAIELPRDTFLRLKFRSYDEACRILKERGVEYEIPLHQDDNSDTNVPLQRDPIERDPNIREKVEHAEERAMTLLSKGPRGMGFCHLLWKTQKQILKDDFGITWKTPAEMNPNVIID